MTKTLSVEKLHHLTGHTASVYALCESVKAGYFYSGGSDRIVVEWSVEGGDGTLIARSTDAIYSLLLINNQLLVGQGQGGIHVINLETGTEERLLQFHTASVFYIGESKKHKLLFSLSGDGDVAVFNSVDFTLVKRLHLIDGKLRTCSINYDESEIAIGGADGNIYLFALPGMEPIKKWQAHQENFSVNALQFTPDGKYLISGSRDAHLNIHNVDEYTLFNSIPAHNYAIYGIAYNHNKTLFATVSRDKTIKIWDAVNFTVLKRIDAETAGGHVHSVNDLIWIGDKLITTGDDRSIILWKIDFK